jgi:HD-GYP domain-containing protein (c-di-GMP phosphodiesterase class II)
LNVFEFSEDIKKIILHHHERYDGTGYPAGLKQKEIPFISRVLSVVDSYYGMISEKPYRKSASYSEALSEIKAGSGTQYDPEVVEAFDEILRDMMSSK